MSWYRTGTAAFTNGNATVTGTGTAWIGDPTRPNAGVGEGLVAPDGRIYEITGVASNTSLTISPAYLGSTASGQAYAIAPIRGRIAQLLSETSSLLASFATVRDGIGSGLFPNGTVSAPALRAAADQDSGLFFPAANTLAMVTGGAERVRVTSAGNMLLGTTTENGRLSVVGDQFSIASGGGSGSLGLQLRGTALDALPAAQVQGYIATGNSGLGTAGDLLIAPRTSVAASVRFITGTTPAERMRIDFNGNVGIGTSSPGAALDVADGGFSLIVGADSFAKTRTNSTSKVARIGSPHFTNAEEDVAFVFLNNSTNSNAINIGGGTGAFNAATDLIFHTAANNITPMGTERMRITSGGNVGIGTSSPAEKLTVTSGHILLSSGFDIRSPDSFALYDTTSAIDRFSFSTSNIYNVRTGGTHQFQTNGSERMRITSGGTVRPGADNTQSLGEASFRWSTVFAGTGTINTSDEREKVWRGAMTEAEMRAAKRLLAELGMFQFTDSIEEKGEDARLHFGVRAQKAFAILEDEGLEWWRYAWCCHDKWDEITEPVMEEVTVEKTRTVEVPEEREVEKTETVMEPVFDEETGEQVMDENGEPVMTEIEQTFTVTETVMVEVEETYEETEQRDTGEVRVVREAGDRYGIRADQLAYWLIAAQAEIQNDLDARLAKLETAQ